MPVELERSLPEVGGDGRRRRTTVLYGSRPKYLYSPCLFSPQWCQSIDPSPTKGAGARRPWASRSRRASSHPPPSSTGRMIRLSCSKTPNWSASERELQAKNRAPLSPHHPWPLRRTPLPTAPHAGSHGPSSRLPPPPPSATATTPTAAAVFPTPPSPQQQPVPRIGTRHWVRFVPTGRGRPTSRHVPGGPGGERASLGDAHGRRRRRRGGVREAAAAAAAPHEGRGRILLGPVFGRVRDGAGGGRGGGGAGGGLRRCRERRSRFRLGRRALPGGLRQDTRRLRPFREFTLYLLLPRSFARSLARLCVLFFLRICCWWWWCGGLTVISVFCLSMRPAAIEFWAVVHPFVDGVCWGGVGAGGVFPPSPSRRGTLFSRKFAVIYLRHARDPSWGRSSLFLAAEEPFNR